MYMYQLRMATSSLDLLYKITVVPCPTPTLFLLPRYIHFQPLAFFGVFISKFLNSLASFFLVYLFIPQNEKVLFSYSSKLPTYTPPFPPFSQYV